MPTAMIPSSATATSSRKPATPDNRWPSAPPGGSARITGGGARWEEEARQNGKAGRQSTTTWSGRIFTAPTPNALWLADITEHRTDEGKLYLCAIKDVFSNRIVGYSIDTRMKSQLATQAGQRGLPACGMLPAAWFTTTGKSISKPEIRSRTEP